MSLSWAIILEMLLVILAKTNKQNPIKQNPHNMEWGTILMFYIIQVGTSKIRSRKQMWSLCNRGRVLINFQLLSWDIRIEKRNVSVLRGLCMLCPIHMWPPGGAVHTQLSCLFLAKKHQGETRAEFWLAKANGSGRIQLSFRKKNEHGTAFHVKSLALTRKNPFLQEIHVLQGFPSWFSGKESSC